MQNPQIICGDSRNLSNWVKPGSVHLIITSPPYNVGTEYRSHNDSMAEKAYAEMLSQVFGQCYNALCEGGRIAVVAPFGIGRQPWKPVAPVIIELLQGNQFTVRGTIIWGKKTSGNRTSWGSFELPTNPVLRDTTEVILVAHKGNAALSVPDGILLRNGRRKYSPFLTDGLFLLLTQDYWIVAPESAKRIGHPAPFPVLLPESLIRLYGYPGCHVLDPFAGSGTVGIAAKKLGCSAMLVDNTERRIGLNDEDAG